VAWCTLFGVDSVEALQQQTFLDKVDDADVDRVRQTLREARASNPPPCQFTALTAGGSRTRLRLEALAAVYEGHAALQIILRPATGNAAHAHKLRLLRSQDLLTGLLNRGGLLARVEAAIAQAIDTRSQCALLLARLQGFDDLQNLGAPLPTICW